MGVQFTWIEANLLDCFLADVRNSWGKFDEIMEEFAMNPAPIASQLSLNMGGSRRTSDFAPNSLNYFTNQSKVEEQKRTHRLFRGDFRPKIRAI